MNKRKKALAFFWSLAATASLTTTTVPVLAAEEWVDNSTLSANGTAEPVKDEVLPDANQYKYQKDELAAFCHFGPNTFNEVEWGEHYGSQTPAQIFRLEQDFDAENYVKTLVDAGFKKLIITAKHHDGFCIFNSKWTTYNCAEAGYKNGEGDILAEISAVCTKYDMDMGLYLSPWDIHEESYGYYDANGNPTTKENDVLDYNDFYTNQLEEILGNDKYGNNGHFVEVWMDGAKGSGANAQEYDFERFFSTIQKNEGKEAGYDADCMLFGAESYTTVRWIGNENGLAADETWSKSTINRADNSINSNKVGAYTQGFENGNQWTVPEADARITSGWFWGNGKKTPKSLQDLSNMYFNSIGHGGVLLLNIPPNNQGTLDDLIKTRTLELGEVIRTSFAHNVMTETGTVIQADNVRGNDSAYSPANLIDGKDDTVWSTSDGTSTGKIRVKLPAAKSIDCVSIEEAIQYGQRINSWSVRYKDTNGSWKDLQSGVTIGPKRLIRTDAFRTDELEITVSVPEGKTPVLSQIGVYRLAEDFANPSAVPNGAELIDINDPNFTFTGNWTAENGKQYLNSSNKWANPGAEFTVDFTGTQIVLLGTLDTGHGTADVYIDDQLVETINMTQASREVNAKIFTSPTLSAGDHTLRLVTKTKATGIEAAMVVNNNNKGMVSIENSVYTMNEDEMMEIKLIRQGGTAPVTVIFSPNPGTAIQDDFNTELNHTVEFAEGETEKTVTVQTRRNSNKTGTQYFTVELSSADPDVILGFNDIARINITDSEADQYSADAPFVFPSTAGETTTLAAANGILYDVKLDSDGKWAMCVSDADWAYNGKFVNCFNQQDTLTVHYNAPKAGTYKAKAYYRSGSTTNQLVWAENDSRITTGSVSAGASSASETKTVEFEFVVTNPGNGVLVFTGPDGKSPQLSHIEITPVSLQSTLTVNCGEHGTSDVETPKGVSSETPETITFTPEDGYALGTVTVNGTAVSADQITDNKLTLSNISEDTVVEASFVFDHYTASNRFAFPDRSEDKTLEAEHFILRNTGEGEAFPLQIASADWASNGKYVNACNSGDSIDLAYTVPAAGEYEVTLTYRSGSASNSFAVSEENGKVDPVTVTAGATSTAQSHTQTFTINVKEAGEGLLKIAAGNTGAPQMDKFQIKVKVDPTMADEVIAAAKAAKESDAWAYYTEASKKALNDALAAAEAMKANPTTVSAFEAVRDALATAINGLEEICEYSLTITAGENGSVTPAGTQTVSTGTPVEITFTPDDGYVVDQVTVNGTATTITDNKLTLDTFDADTTVHATFVFDHYTAANPFVFPENTATKTLEAEHSILKNSGTGEQWPLMKSSAAWASSGKFVNACNSGDSIEIPYTAAQAGTYQAVLTFRSGDSRNSFVLSEASGKIETRTVTAGASDSAGATHTQSFEIVIKEAGSGVIRIAAGNNNAPQMDKFEITAPAKQTVDPEPDLDYELLRYLVTEVEAAKDQGWVDSAALDAALERDKAVIDNADTQAEIDAAVRDLHQVWLDARYVPSREKLNDLK